jgi:hypothetical protein
MVVSNGPGRADKSAGKAGNAVFGMSYGAESCLLIKSKDLGGADINAHLAATARLFMDKNFYSFRFRHWFTSEWF